MVAFTAEGRRLATEAAARQQSLDRKGRENPVYAYAANAATQYSATLSKPATKEDKK